MSRLLHHAPTLLGALALAGYAAFAADSYALRLLALAGINALLALGYQFVFGLAGTLSLAQAGFFGIGAYAAALLATRYEVGLVATLPAGLLAVTLVAFVVALPLGRLSSHYFALASLGIAQLLLIGAVNLESLTGGANGISGIPGLSLLGWRVPRGLATVALVWSVLGVAMLVFAWRRAGLGDAAWRSLRETPRAAAAIGLDAPRMRLHAFLASAACGGAAGVLQAHVVGVVSPDVIGMGTMIACLAAVVIGGRGTATGAVLGALLLTHLPEWFRFLEQHALTAYGIGLLAAVVLAPEGLVGLWQRFFPTPAVPTPLARGLPAATPGCPAVPVLSFRGVTRRFGGVTAADAVNLTIGRGEAVGLIGPNGAGKTTLLNIASGFLTADAGTIEIAGRRADGLPPHRIARLGLARSFQTSDLAPGVTVLDAVALAASGRGDPRRRALAAGLLRHMDLLPLAGRRCETLPPGPRRLVEIARALATDPQILLLDEPAAGLDASEADRLAALLRGLDSRGVALLLVEHDMRFLAGLATRLACLDQGRIVAEGATAAVLADPEVRRLYLGPDHG